MSYGAAAPAKTGLSSTSGTPNHRRRKREAREEEEYSEKEERDQEEEEEEEYSPGFFARLRRKLLSVPGETFSNHPSTSPSPISPQSSTEPQREPLVEYLLKIKVFL